MKIFSLSCLVLLMFSTSFVSGCAGRRSGELPVALTDAETADPAVGHVQQVTKLARRSIEADLRTRLQDRETVRHSRPYYFKEYAEYPDGSSNLEVTIQETDSRTSPYRAQVQYPKIRYVTKLHTRRLAAEADNDFFRDTGEETMNFELRNGRWILMGATFVAQRSEELVAGEWQPVRDRTPRLTPVEEPRGFIGRTWGRLTGGD